MADKPMRDCAVLFADVAGSTSLYEIFGDKKAFGLIEQCLATMGECTKELHGRVVKTIGDAVMAVFPSADDAAAAAAEMQLRVSKSGKESGAARLGPRIGFHYGPVVDQEKDGDVFGDTVNLVSRLSDLASRAYAMIEHRRGHFFVVDHSGNGTFVTLEGKPEMHVHREELTLLGHGWISFGRPRAESQQVLEFRVVETWRPGAPSQ